MSSRRDVSRPAANHRMRRRRQNDGVRAEPSLTSPFGAAVLACGIAAAALVSGCVESSRSRGAAAFSPDSSGGVAVSTLPHKAAAAYDQSEKQLSGADWNVINKMGPDRPIIEKLSSAGNDRLRNEASQAASGPSGNLAAGQSPSTRHATTEPLAATRPADKLPLTVLPLADDRVQMIWSLRSIGGVHASAQIDHGTSRRQVTVKEPDLGALVKVVESRLGKDGTVLPLPEKNALVINCPDAMRDSIVKLLSQLDVPRPQVHITAKIFETSHDFDYQQGARVLLKHIASDGTQSVLSTFDTERLLQRLSGGDTPYQGSILGLVQTFESSGISLSASLQLLAESGLISVVSSPRMTVATGQTGYMLAGQELPIQSSSMDDGKLEISTSYKPVGVQLYITPESAGEDSVKLHLITIVSSVEGFAPFPTLGADNSASTLVNPIIKSREAETVVATRPGNTLVISGMKMVRNITLENKIPLLGDLPLIGDLFKNYRSQRQATDLYFFITPSLASAE